MSIAEFIRESVLRPRLKQAGCLVVYDADKRYREQCFDLAADKVRVIDTSKSSIESREAALRALREVGQPKAPLEGILIYVSTKRPETDEQKQIDPFSPFAVCGSIFLRVESGREILVALLAPSASQTEALKGQEGWGPEARDFLRATLGLNVKTRGKTWSALADELWRYVLFSEFVFDLPVALPDTLKGAPHAPMEARPIVEDVCDRLRGDPKSRAVYIERAEAIEAELNLTDLCGAIEDLGERDTFPFEERTFLRAAIKGIVTGDTDATRRMLCGGEEARFGWTKAKARRSGSWCGPD